MSLLTVSPMAKGTMNYYFSKFSKFQNLPPTLGLFHRAILQSGTATCPYVTRAGTGVKEAKKLAAELDCPSSNAEYLVECLQKIKPELLAVKSLSFNEFVSGGNFENLKF